MPVPLAGRIRPSSAPAAATIGARGSRGNPASQNTEPARAVPQQRLREQVYRTWAPSLAPLPLVPSLGDPASRSEGCPASTWPVADPREHRRSDPRLVLPAAPRALPRAPPPSWRPPGSAMPNGRPAQPDSARLPAFRPRTSAGRGRAMGSGEQATPVLPPATSVPAAVPPVSRLVLLRTWVFQPHT